MNMRQSFFEFALIFLSVWFFPLKLKKKKKMQDKWSAVYNVQTILLSLQSLLGEPNNDSPLNAQAAQLWEKPEGSRLFLFMQWIYWCVAGWILLETVCFAEWTIIHVFVEYKKQLLRRYKEAADA